MPADAAALLVDYGGVLTTSVIESFGAFCETEGIDAEVFRRVMLESARAPGSMFALVESGAIEQEEFDRRLAAALSDACGKAIDAAGLKQRLFARAQPDVAMASGVRAVRAAGFPTVLVSNSWGGRDYPGDVLEQLFDHLVISGLVGMRKPDADIYLHAAARAGVEPSSCVFVDDFRVNVEGAEAVGMTGLLHRDATATLGRLEELFGLGLAADGSDARG